MCIREMTSQVYHKCIPLLREIPSSGGFYDQYSFRLIVRCLLSFFLPFLLVLAYGSPVAGRAINWTIDGPEGGPVNCFVSPDATGTLIYAGCNGGVYKSTDAGEHWQYLPKSPPLVRFLAINPHNPDILYAGWINGVSKSSDGGRTWQLTLNSGYDTSFYIPLYSGRPPTGLAVDPVNPQNVYATFASTFQNEGGRCTAPFATAATAARPGPKPTRPSMGQ